MGRNGGKIKEIQVSLLLSSRAEMQKVIEKARQSSASSFMSKISATQASSVMSAAAIANQFAKKMPEAAVQVIPPQAPVISLTNFLTQSMQQQGQQNTPGLHAQQLNLMPAYQTMPPSDIPGLGGLTSVTPVTTSLPAMPMGMPQNAAAAAAAYANYYATLMDPNALNYVNSIAAAGISAKSIGSQRDAYNSDPRNQRSNSRDRNAERNQRSRSLERKSSRRSRSNSRDDSDEKGKDDRRRRTRFSAATDKPEIPRLAPTIAKSTAAYGPPPPASNGVWDNPPPQLFGIDIQNSIPMNKPNQFLNFNNGSNSLPPPTRNYQTESKSTDSAFGNIGSCVKVGNVDNETFYSDIRKFFTGLPIGNNDIKFLTDNKNNRTGIALVRFLSSDSKKKALTKSMWPLKSTQVMITSITEEDFETGLMNKINANRQGGNSNDYRNDDRRDRYKDRSEDRDYTNRNPSRQDGNNRSNNRSDDRQRDNNRDQGNLNRNQSGNFREPDGNNREQNNFRREQNKNFRNDRVEEQEKAKYMPDENFTVLAIDDIPRTANEPDICEAFPNILSIVIDRYTAYVKFSSHEAAKATLENRFIHYIRNKRVFLDAGSLVQFNELARKLGKYENRDGNGEASVGGENRDDNFKTQINDDSNSRDSSSRNRDQTQFESRDPRQRNFSNDRSNTNDRLEQQGLNDRFGDNGQPQNFLNTDCVIMKNMEPNTTIEDVEFFYKDIGIYKMRVHILLDKRGNSDSFVIDYLTEFFILSNRSSLWRLLCGIQISQRFTAGFVKEQSNNEKKSYSSHANSARASRSCLELIWGKWLWE